MSKNTNFVRYLVVGKETLSSHAYSTLIPDAKSYAIDCAMHKTMLGDVFGIDAQGKKNLIFSAKKYFADKKKKS